MKDKTVLAVLDKCSTKMVKTENFILRNRTSVLAAVRGKFKNGIRALLHHHHHGKSKPWSYNDPDSSPTHWARLGYEEASGLQQSPIDIATDNVVSASSAPDTAIEPLEVLR